LKNDNMNKYHPKYDSIDRKLAMNIKFDEVKTKPRDKSESINKC
jgi:hypothetical protein